MRRFVIIPIRTMRIFPGQWFSIYESSVKGKIVENFVWIQLFVYFAIRYYFVLIFDNFRGYRGNFQMVINSEIMLPVHGILIWKSFVILYGGLQG